MLRSQVLAREVARWPLQGRDLTYGVHDYDRVLLDDFGSDEVTSRTVTQIQIHREYELLYSYGLVAGRAAGQSSAPEGMIGAALAGRATVRVLRQPGGQEAVVVVAPLVAKPSNLVFGTLTVVMPYAPIAAS